MLTSHSRLIRQLLLFAAAISSIVILLRINAGLPEDHAFRLTLPTWQRNEYYEFHTLPAFPTLTTHTDDSERADHPCSTFPFDLAKHVQVVLKTGSGQEDRVNDHLSADISCSRDTIIVSDFEEHIQDHHVVDVLANLNPAYYEHEDFAGYIARQKGLDGPSDAPTGLGWKLDRFKFLPMINLAYDQNPEAKWYLFLEDDVYIFWDNLFRFLTQMDPTGSYYFGTAVAGANHTWFAYGGAGFIISQNLMQRLVGDGTDLGDKYRDLAMRDCCGDAVVAYVIEDKTGVRMQNLYPMFTGEELEKTRIDEKRWCSPLITLHRAIGEQVHSLWQWERTRPSSRVSQTCGAALYRKANIVVSHKDH